jgi:hypothetical protein
MNNKKAFNGSATTSFYKTKSPSGKDVIFTITDLVQGKGKLKDPDGDGSTSFKPKKYKAHTISDMVNKPDFGKTKKNIKKLSYRSRPEEELIVSEILPSINQVDDSYTENGGRFGFIMPGDTYPVSSGLPHEVNPNITPDMYGKKTSIENDALDEVLEDLANNSECMDNLVLSDFVNFLIIKNAQVKNVSYESMYVDYIYKIYMSDVPNSMSKIEKFSFDFSELTRKYFDSGLTLEKAKEMAYKNIISKTGILKQAQVVTTDPKFVGEQVAKIILIMIAKFSINSRNKARANIRGRISNLNVSDIVSKKTPAGAAIGTSIALIKNILNGKDGYFVKSVLEELKKHI